MVTGSPTGRACANKTGFGALSSCLFCAPLKWQARGVDETAPLQVASEMRRRLPLLRTYNNYSLPQLANPCTPSKSYTKPDSKGCLDSESADSDTNSESISDDRGTALPRPRGRRRLERALNRIRTSCTHVAIDGAGRGALCRGAAAAPAAHASSRRLCMARTAVRAIFDEKAALLAAARTAAARVQRALALLG